MIERNLRCPQGDYFEFVFTIRRSKPGGEPGEAVDQTGVLAFAEVRDSLSKGNLVATMNFDSSAEELENGIIKVSIEDSVTEEIPIGTYFYDIVLADFDEETQTSRQPKTLFQGKFLVINRVTENV